MRKFHADLMRDRLNSDERAEVDRLVAKSLEKSKAAPVTPCRIL